MPLAHQPSMWDLAEQATLRPLAVTRHHLSRGAWIDHLPGWVEGYDEVLEVLLVDDLADSRWTMTVAGRELRLAGASRVLPFALALTA